MEQTAVDILRDAWKKGTWDDGEPVNITVEWLLFFKMEELLEVLKELIK